MSNLVVNLVYSCYQSEADILNQLHIEIFKLFSNLVATVGKEINF